MKQSIMFSIIIPVYNVAPYLSKCLDSAARQQYDNFEIIIINDGSADNSLCIAEEYAKRYNNITLFSQKNAGLGAARNRGIEAARGEYLFFLDSDDYLDLYALPKVSDILVRNADIDLVIFDVNAVSEKHKEIRVMPGKNLALWDQNRSEISNNILCSIPAAWNKVYKRSLFQQHGIRYPENIWFEDITVTEEIFLIAEKSYYLQEPLYFYVSRKGSIMRSRNTAKNYDITAAFDRLCGYYRKAELYEKYAYELEFLAVLHVIIYPQRRISRINPLSECRKKLLQYMENRFPEFMDNPYLGLLSANDRTQLNLIHKKQYLLFYAVYNGKHALWSLIPHTFRRCIKTLTRKGTSKYARNAQR